MSRKGGGVGKSKKIMVGEKKVLEASYMGLVIILSICADGDI